MSVARPLLQCNGVAFTVAHRAQCFRKLRRTCTTTTQGTAVTTSTPAAIETRPPSQLPQKLTIDKPTNLMDTIESAAVAKTSPPSIQHLWNSLLSRVGVSDRVMGLIMINVMTLIMSTNFVVVKDAEAILDPFSFSSLRFIAAALPFLPFLARMKIDRETMCAGAEIGLWSTLGYLTQGMSLLTTDASRVSFLSALTVILVPIIVGLTGRGVPKLIWGSAGMAVVGVSLLSGNPMDGTLGMGDLLSLISAAAIAIQIVRTEHFARVLPPKRRISALGLSMLFVAASSSVASVVTHPELLINSCQQLGGFSLQSMMSSLNQLPTQALLYTGFISTDIVLLIELFALNKVNSTDAAIIYTMEPVLGALWAYLLLGERWGPTGWIGAALIVGSSFITQVYGAREK